MACAVTSLQVHEESVMLRAGERAIVHLRVVPLRPGSLQVHGLAWRLNGAAAGQKAFSIPRAHAFSSKLGSTKCVS